MKKFIVILFFLSGIFANKGEAQLGEIVKIGEGEFSWMKTGPDGMVHVTYNGKYRFGMSIFNMSAEENVTLHRGDSFSCPKIDVDPKGNPHIVYQFRPGDSAHVLYYTARKAGKWLPLERLAERSEISETCNRVMMPDVATDASGNVLACFWPVENQSSLGLAIYRWRNGAGTWGNYKGGFPRITQARQKWKNTITNFICITPKAILKKCLRAPLTPWRT